jgi:hypothetical protein
MKCKGKGVTVLTASTRAHVQFSKHCYAQRLFFSWGGAGRMRGSVVSYTPRLFYFWRGRGEGKAPVAHRTGGSVSSKTSLDALKKKKTNVSRHF